MAYKENQMSEEEKLIAEIATKILVEKFRSSGYSRDLVYAEQARALATKIVRG